MKNPVAHFEYSSGISVTAELFLDRMPNAVKAFAALASSGVFNNFPVERVIPDVLIQPSYTEYDRDEGKILTGDGVSRDFLGETGEDVLLCIGGDVLNQAPADYFFATSRYKGEKTVIGKVLSGWKELSEKCFPGAVKLRDIEPLMERYVPAKALNQKKVWVDTFGEAIGIAEKRRMPPKTAEQPVSE